MTPKEKAEKLINKNYKIFEDDEDEHFIDTSKRISKQCALIAVDEIINNFGSLADGKMFYTSSYTIVFYQQVKQEIENL